MCTAAPADSWKAQSETNICPWSLLLFPINSWTRPPTIEMPEKCHQNALTAVNISTVVEFRRTFTLPNPRTLGGEACARNIYSVLVGKALQITLQLAVLPQQYRLNYVVFCAKTR